MNFNSGELWLINFDPSFGHEYKKMRPGLIIGSDKFININSLITVIPISSKIDRKSELDILIIKDSENRLMNDSLIKLFQISSFDKRRMVKYIGKCNDKVNNQVKEKLKLYFDIL
ncbi:MAG TPA: type II toxin-antitoxin system PemK/MazF family toxin [Spirochaetota bacterium]|nr:type II toxin-antitoxin system PemK/MazF family toxin [Spirochaetota bacterium]HOS32419.1 type II toxin-antitoxin system PemK/MazF family toxin [Spirochaetota bacterium]HOS55838.1 type II toxin-antitoxin system PemK/MazF family toxin [Spirochaetota bacterium]HPK62834.1 type II toxin-antitoxin system PemK/MazF family toxin [Spirochaetota bacterium]HQF77916.1 type II toxin-antitoxin system PemK/MazF family toxin [Spirochaetota bacterium]